MNTFLSIQQEFSAHLAQPFYHMISDEDVPYVKHLYSYRDVKTFEDDIDFFCKHYNPVDVLQVLDAHRGGKPLPECALHLSFDDGFRVLYDIVAPILLKKGIPATFFINKNFVDNREMFYRNKASLLIDFVLQNEKEIDDSSFKELFLDNGIVYDNFKQAILSLEHGKKNIIDLAAAQLNFSFEDFIQKEKPYLTTQQVKEMMKMGFHFGAHSIDHPKYSTITLKEQLRQTEESMQYVQETFQPGYKVFAFPFNDLGVSRQFYQKIFDRSILDMSFGTAEMIDDIHPNNKQRTWFENIDMDAESRFIQNYTDRKTRIEAGSNTMVRTFGELRTYTKAQFEKALETDALWQGNDQIPITKYRARAHANNPRADAEDLVLVTMHDEDVLIGYLGVLPDTLYINGVEHKWGWLTCWWVNPDYSGKGIGQEILNHIHQFYQGNIGCSEFTEFGQKAAERSGKLQAFEIKGKLFELKPANTLIAEGSKNWNDDIAIEYLNEIDYETSLFIESHRKVELTKRGKIELNWILHYPWVLTAPYKDETSSRLFFSSVTKSFAYYAIKIKQRTAMIGFVILKVRDGKMTVPYFYSKDEKSVSKIVDVLLSHATEIEVSSLKLFNTALVKELVNKSNEFVQVSDVVKRAFFSNQVSLEDIASVHIQDGDGDNGFT